MNIRLDGNEIRIQMDSVSDCDELISDTGYYRVRELAEGFKATLFNRGVNYGKYVEWWNNEIVPELLRLSFTEQDIFKWELVKQEINMWIHIDKPVGEDEISWMSDRRGFSPLQRGMLVEAMKVVGLYSEANTMYFNDTLDKMGDIEDVETFAKQVGYDIEGSV